ncbi:HAD family hydrolase [Myxococcota bacterium]
MGNISAVIFDLGRVLVDWDITQSIWDLIREEVGPAGDHGPRRQAWERLYAELATGRLTPEGFYQKLKEQVNVQVGYDQFVKSWCEIFFPMQGMEELFTEMEKHVVVGLLSDTDPVHWEYLLPLYPFLKRIKKPTLSFEIGWMKPAPEAYLAAARDVGFSPEQCFFTDDKPENIEGAKQVGMDGVVFSGAEDLRRQFVDRGVLTPK